MNPKLSDFGFARFYNNTEPLLDTWCGTFNYVAP
jgi:serine/threonine protein kinase